MRQAAGEQLEQHHAERIQVRASVDAAAGHLLGRHERRRAEHHAGSGAARVGDARDPEVGHLHGVGRQVDHHVGRLDVAVHDPLAVRIGQRLGDACDDAQHHRHRQQLRLLRVALQVVAFQELHRDVGEVLVLAGIEDRHDVAMLQSPRRLGLAEETFARLGEFGAVELLRQRHRLDRHLAADLRIVAEIHRTHRTAPELSIDAVAAERRAVRRLRRGSRRRLRFVGGHGLRLRRAGCRALRQLDRCARRAALGRARSAQSEVPEREPEQRGPDRDPQRREHHQRPARCDEAERDGRRQDGRLARCEPRCQCEQIEGDADDRQQGQRDGQRRRNGGGDEPTEQDLEERLRCGHGRCTLAQARCSAAPHVGLDWALPRRCNQVPTTTTSTAHAPPKM